MLASMDVDPQRRKWRGVLALGIFLTLGPALGYLGTAFGMLYSFDRIESLKAPTPGDLSTGVHISMLAEVLGLLMFPFGVWLIVLSCSRLAKLWNEANSGRIAS
jgi:hypothetical protein